MTLTLIHFKRISVSSFYFILFAKFRASIVTNRTYLHSVMFAMKFHEHAMLFPIPNFPNADAGGYDIALRYMSREISFLYLDRVSYFA